MMALCVGILIALGMIMLLKKHYLSIIFSLILIGNGINLSIFFTANPNPGWFAFVKISPLTQQVNDPIPQALGLTAIVIGFALLGFVVALTKNLAKEVGDMDSPRMQEEDTIE